jgi:energy-coupling factor transport system ATP-binding protein
MKIVARLIRQLRDRTTLLLIITHDLEFIFECCTYALLMEQGNVINQYPINFENAERLKNYFHILEKQ